MEGPKIVLKNEVQTAINDVLHSLDPLDKSDFNSTGKFAEILSF